MIEGRIQTTDFCRSCKGKGRMTAAPGELEPRCRYCDGTGRQTTLILAKPGKNPDRPDPKIKALALVDIIEHELDVLTQPGTTTIRDLAEAIERRILSALEEKTDE